MAGRPAHGSESGGLGRTGAIPQEPRSFWSEALFFLDTN